MELAFWAPHPPRPGEGWKPESPSLIFARETARKDEHHSKPRVKTEVVRGGDKPWGLWGAKYWKTKHRKEDCRPKVPTSTWGQRQTPSVFRIFSGNRTFLIEYAKKMYFCASPRTVHTLWPENASHFMEMVKKHRKSV